MSHLSGSNIVMKRCIGNRNMFQYPQISGIYARKFEIVTPHFLLSFGYHLSDIISSRDT